MTTNSNLSSFQTGVDALYDMIVSLGVTPTDKTLAAIKASIQSVHDTGYAKGYSTGRSSTRTLKYEIEGIVQGEGDIWSRFDVYLIDSSGSKTLIHRQMGAGTSDFSVEVTDSMWSD